MTDLLKQIDPELFSDDVKLTVLGSPEEPLFVAKEICDLLGYKNYCGLLKKMPEKYRQQFQINGWKNNILNFKGICWIIIYSNKSSTNTFKKWIVEHINK